MEKDNIYFTAEPDVKKLNELCSKYISPGSLVLEPFAGENSIPEGMPDYTWTTNDVNKFPGVTHTYNLDYRDIPIPSRKFGAVVTNPPFRESIYMVEMINFLGLFSDWLFLVVPCGMMKFIFREKLRQSKWLFIEDHPSCDTFYCKLENRKKKVRCRIIGIVRCEQVPPENALTFCADFYISKDPNRCDVAIRKKSVCGAYTIGEYKDKDHFNLVFHPDKKEKYMSKIDEISKAIYEYSRRYSMVISNVSLEEVHHIFQFFA